MVRNHPHLDAGKDQEYAEYVTHPAELAHQCGAQSDHDRAQRYHAQNAPEKHTVLLVSGNGKERENSAR